MFSNFSQAIRKFAGQETDVYWDVEDSSILNEHDPALIYENITSALSKKGYSGYVSIHAYIDDENTLFKELIDQYCGFLIHTFSLPKDQLLVARLLSGTNIGLEIPRNEQVGSFTSASVVEIIRLVVAEEEGKSYRNNAASQQKKIFGNKRLQDQYADAFIEFLENHRAGVQSK